MVVLHWQHLRFAVSHLSTKFAAVLAPKRVSNNSLWESNMASWHWKLDETRPFLDMSFASWRIMEDFPAAFDSRLFRKGASSGRHAG